MKLKYTIPQIIVEVIGVILLVTLFVILGIKYGSLPNKIPTHFNAAGEIDGWGGKLSIFTLPILGVLIYILTTVITFFPSSWNFSTSKMTPKNEVPLYQCMKTFLIVTKVEMVTMFFYTTLNILKGTAMSSMFVYIIFAVLIITGLVFLLFGKNIIKKYV